ncbi:MAG: ankyrin repeat domain-containing protein [Gammaproteobacteria bacterium]
MEATRREDEKAVVTLCDLSREALFKAEEAFRALFVAAKKGNVKIAVNLLSALMASSPHENFFAKQDKKSNRTFLHEALFSQQSAFVINMIQRAELSLTDIKDGKGYTLLHLAAKLGFADIIDEMSQPARGLEVDALTLTGKTALYLAVKAHQTQVISKLLENHANINVTFLPNNETALHLAARSGFEDVVTLLLQYCPELHGNLLGDTPYHVAKHWGHESVAEKILQYQNERTFESFSALLLGGMTIDSDNVEQSGEPSLSRVTRPSHNYLLRYPAWQPSNQSPSNKYRSDDEVHRIFELGQNLGHRAVYAHPPDGLDIIVGDELANPHLYRTYTLFNQGGIRCYAWIPHETDLEIYILLAGTDDEITLKRDVTEITPGYQSFKQQARAILMNLSRLFAQLQVKHSLNPFRLSIIGHSLGAGDSYALFIGLLKSITNNTLETLRRFPDEDAFEEILKSNWPHRDECDLEVMRLKALENIKNSAYKGIELPVISRIRVIALNSVMISKKASLEYEGITTYAKFICPEMKLEAYNLIIPSDFANLTGDAYPLIHMNPEMLEIHLQITNINRYALETGMGLALMGVAMNPTLASNSNPSLLLGALVAGGTAAFTLGPIGAVSAMLITGCGIKGSHLLFNRACSTIIAPHQHLPDAEESHTEIDIVHLTNQKPSERQKLIEAADTGELAKLVYGLIKRSVASSFSAPKLVLM